MTESDIYAFASLRIQEIYQLIKASPGMSAGDVAREMDSSATSVIRTVNQHGMTMWHIKMIAITGYADTSDYVPVRKPPSRKSRIKVPEWLTRPIRSYKHTTITYSNGVTP